ncbi:MAG: Gfo/Idh/MocA family oxidoreductase [Candidatus Firestonebacteria bacterium]
MQKLRVGMIGGGGPQNFFGKVHRRSISLDTTRELVAGALRSNPEDAISSAKELGINGYPNYKSLVDAVDKEKLDYFTIVTPNDAHFAPAKLCIEKNVPVLCEKPMTRTVEDAKTLVKIVKSKKVPFILAHTYTGHPMYMLAREFVQNGDIGEVRKVESWYTQGWLANKSEDTGLKQAQWRVNPKKAGISCCGGDIGTHAHMAVRWITGLEVVKVSAKLNIFIKGRKLDDDFNVFAELENGATSIITATQIAIGYKNDNGFRIFGTKGSIEWNQERAESLIVKYGGADKVYWLGANYDYFPAIIKPYLRLPAGHNEDFFEALANLHLTMEFIVRKRNGEKNIPVPYSHPGVEDGLAGMLFLDATVQSSKSNGAWINIKS